ncbi:MAG: general stress protein [Microbacterium sp.]
MSMMSRLPGSADLGEIVASTKEYEAAQKTVSMLIAGEVPARDIAIVGQGVRSVERVTGKLGYATAARSGATNGVLIGLFMSAIMVFGNPDAPIQLFLGMVLIGVALGMLMSLVTFAIVRRRRDFASITQLVADHYEVRVQPASLAKARQVTGAGRPEPVRPAVNLDEPPRYGERITPNGVVGGGAGSGLASQTPAAGGASGDRPIAPPLPPASGAPAPTGDAPTDGRAGRQPDSDDGATEHPAADGDEPRGDDGR